MKTGLLFTGGKDSCLALHKFGKNKVDVLLSLIPENKDSFMFHCPDLGLLEMQAEMLGLDLVLQGTKGEKEELDDLKNLIKKSKVKRIVAGGIGSNYQGERIKKICSELGVEFVAPLWNYASERLWKELLGEGFEVVITKIASEGLGKEWIGRVIDNENFKELEKLSGKFGFRLDFEGGDAETGVLYMPGFEKKIEIEFDVVSEGDYRHFMKIGGVR